MIHPNVRRIFIWGAVVAVAGIAFYKLKLAPVAVAAHLVAKGAIVGEVMGTGTLEARVKTTIGACASSARRRKPFRWSASAAASASGKSNWSNTPDVSPMK